MSTRRVTHPGDENQMGVGMQLAKPSYFVRIVVDAIAELAPLVNTMMEMNDGQHDQTTPCVAVARHASL